MLADETMRALKDIQSRDPDSLPTEPTEADYVRFDQWVIDTYGIEMLVRYSTTDWNASVASWE